MARQGHGPGRVRLRRRGWGETQWHELRNGLGSRDCETGRRWGADPHRAGYHGAASPAPESSFQALGRNSAQGRRVRCRTQRLAEGRLCAGWQQDCERLQRYVSGMASGLVLLGFSAAPHVRRPHPRNGGRQVAAGAVRRCLDIGHSNSTDPLHVRQAASAGAATRPAFPTGGAWPQIDHCPPICTGGGWHLRVDHPRWPAVAHTGGRQLGRSSARTCRLPVHSILLHK